MDRIIYCTDGSLEVFRSGVVRENFSRHHRTIDSVADFKATLRAGRYVWPGGYPLGLVCSDGEMLCFTCAKANFKLIVEAIWEKFHRNDWKVIGTQSLQDQEEDENNHCAHCGDKIE